VRDVAPDAIVVEAAKNAGYAAGINLGIAAAPYDGPVLVVNPDVRLRPGALAALEAALVPPAGITVPKIVDERGGLVFSLRRDATVRRSLGEAVLGGSRARNFAQWGQVVGDRRAYETSHAVEWASGAVMLLSRDCISAVGAWDESFFLYSEEVDYCLRARERGFEIRYVPAAVAQHEGGEMHTAAHLWALQLRNKVRLFRRRHGAAHTMAYRGTLVLYEAVRAVPPGSVHRTGLRTLLHRDVLEGHR
jgi:GT2 family glycosyltransferase